jgi:site-specific DNA-methyltransferase (adenine-specific)
MWYVGGDNKNGESDKAKSSFFTSDGYFRISEYFWFCNRLLKPEPTNRDTGAPCMIVFCSWEQQADVVKWAEDAGFKKHIPMTFIKNYSAQVLKANMKVVGATEYAIVLYRDRLPKFRNGGQMVFNWMPWERDGNDIPKIHPTQKPVKLLKRLIEIFTDPGDVVIDPVAGSGSTLRAAAEMRRNAYGFEIDRDFYREATEKMLKPETFAQMNLVDLELQQKYEQMRIV